MPLIPLQAGPVTLLFQQEDAMVRYLYVGPHEVLRGITAPVRDRNWGTVKPVVSDLKVDQGADRFRVTFSVDCREGDIDFGWCGELTGEADGTVTYRFHGSARSSFLKNRIGFCVLHPPSVAGKSLVAEHPDGSTDKGAFPEDILPGPPFTNLRALTTDIAPGIHAEVRMEGDVFETEDQRNWLDASFKTFCTPLSLPFPAAMKVGDTVVQTVTVRIHKDDELFLPPVKLLSGAVRVAVDRFSNPLPLPAIGFAWDPEDARPLNRNERQKLREVWPAHLRVDFDASNPALVASANIGVDEAVAASSPLEVALHLDDANAAATCAWAAGLMAQCAMVVRWLVFDRTCKAVSDPKWPETVKGWIAAGKLQEAPVVSGSAVEFVDLNRNRPPHASLAGVCYSANPQVHAFDDLSLMETHEMLAFSIGNARRISGGKPVHVTPLSLRRRFNPDATAAEVVPAGALPKSVDPRQATGFGAAWTLGALEALAEGGAASATFYAVRGPRGLFEADRGSAWPSLFPSEPGGEYPLMKVFRVLSDSAATGVLRVENGDPLRVAALALATQAGIRLLLANATGEDVDVRASTGGGLVGSVHLPPHGFVWM